MFKNIKDEYINKERGITELCAEIIGDKILASFLYDPEEEIKYVEFSLEYKPGCYGRIGQYEKKVITYNNRFNTTEEQKKQIKDFMKERFEIEIEE